MTTLTIDLLRHGITERGSCFLGRTDAALTAEGWQQMQQGLAGLKPEDYDAIYASPLQRCAAFARHWAGAATTVQLDARLREYDFGDWDGLTAADVHVQDPEGLGRFWQDPWHHCPPGGEALPDFFARLEACIDSLQQHHRGRVLLICHGGVIRALHCILHGLPVSEMFNYAATHGSLHHFRDQR
ncbi:histidine phosphatase family protein [Marinobacterium weihaiense]|uniref:Histidine phosphatase family protein n=1 Tax=Marinobacterium weihaiense TaxID=2851016 RepID=A0ABS6MCC2_9GAMM|nr:histidine phosphatase family protein [Marinobacterium weihaiense]MBV0933362.1 histidine phosphatase family protein [Marinobacterium weihaiense]